jgi:hypothetical protein
MLIVFFAIDIPDRCGAFFSDLCLAKEFKARGHQIVLISCAKNPTNFAGGEYEGFRWKPYVSAGKELDQSQLWISPHYPHGNIVRKLNQAFKRPILFTLHFAGARNLFNVPFPVTWPEMFWSVNNFIPGAVLDNRFPKFVVQNEVRRPFIDPAPILLEEAGTHEYITLVNANMIKGLAQFLKIAAKMPNHKFLGIRSFYHPPTDKTLEVPPNIEWIDFTRDVKSIYARTRIMLILSGTESFCITAVESMVNGIPVLYASPSGGNYSDTVFGTTEGMQEWIDPVGIGLPRDDTDAWVAKLIELDDEATYSAISEASRQHGKTVCGTVRAGADAALLFAAKNTVKPNTLMTIQHEASRVPGPTVSLQTVPLRPNQPAAWRNGRLTFGRR